MPIVNGLFYSGWGDPTTGLAPDLLSGKTLNNEDGDNVVGNMPNNGAVGGTITQQAGKVIIPSGYTSGGEVQANITNLAAANIKSGVTVGGVAGTFTADADAVAGNILTAKTAYVAGSKITGSMANRGAITQTISTQGGQYTVPAGYHNGSGKVTASFANLVAANVRAGVNVGGVIGTVREFKYSTGVATLSASGSWTRINAINLGWKPHTMVFRGDFVVDNSSSGYGENEPESSYAFLWDENTYALYRPYRGGGITKIYDSYLSDTGYNGSFRIEYLDPRDMVSGQVVWEAIG